MEVYSVAVGTTKRISLSIVLKNGRSLSMRRKVPSPSRRTRDGEASTKPSLLAAVVEAARSWGGQLFALLGSKLRRYPMERHLFTWDREQFERASSLRPGRHAALQLFKPVQHDVDLRRRRLR